MLEEETKFMTTNSGSGIFVIHKDVVEDSEFPFKVNDKVKVVVDPKRKEIIIRKKEEKKNE